MIRTLSYRASVKESTHRRLESFLVQQTELWKDAFQERIDCYQKTGTGISFHDQCKSLTEMRGEFDDFKQFNAHCQRSVPNRLDKACRRVFDGIKQGTKVGFPRFKPKDRGVRSFDISSPYIHQGHLVAKGIGAFKVKHIPDKTVAARVVRTPLRISVQFVVELEEAETRPAEAIGIDLGVTDRVVLSTGASFQVIKLNRKTLERKQRILGRAKKGSNSRKRKKVLLAKEWQRVRGRERNAAHRLTTEIVRKGNRIAIEDLQIGNMRKNRRLAMAISEQQ